MPEPRATLLIPSYNTGAILRQTVEAALGSPLPVRVVIDGSTDGSAATLDGLGAVGEGAHAPNEHVRLEATIRRTALLALLIAEPPLGKL